MKLSDTVKAIVMAGLIAAPLMAFGQTATDSRSPATPLGDALGEAELASVRTGWRASKLIGMNVANERDEKVGTLDELVIARDTRAPTAILSVGGFLGVGARLVAVPFARLQFDAEGNRLLMQGASAEALKQLPPFEYRG